MSYQVLVRCNCGALFKLSKHCKKIKCRLCGCLHQLLIDEQFIRTVSSPPGAKCQNKKKTVDQCLGQATTESEIDALLDIKLLQWKQDL